MNAERKPARDLIAFYLDCGADALIGEEPVDRLADEVVPRKASAAGFPLEGEEKAAPGRPVEQERRGEASAMAKRREGGEPASPARGNGTPSSSLPLKGGGSMPAPASPEAAVMAARDAARHARTLDDLYALLKDFDGCALRATATQLVFADGNPQGRVMFVGEAPGHDEDVIGRPFVGRSGKLLDLMMAAIALDRSSAYIANVVPWRPPGNRTPTPQETAICLPFIRRQIELADPDILVCLGGPAMQTLLGIKDGITRARGRWLGYDTGKREIRALATFHPAFLLRSPLQKRFAWRDFLAIKKALVPTIT